MSSASKSSTYRGVTLFRPTMKWRAQISANGKTTSLGDHDTEEQAATAFDRASISKAGQKAKTNFPLQKYKDEIAELEGMDLNELVAMLRSKAKKHGAQTSHFRGVSLLKQTKKWHAQINVGGKQVHLGFFPTEEFAARAYDRAAINKGAQENTPRIVTNFDIAEYKEELDFLRQVPQQELIDALATESKRRQHVTPAVTLPPSQRLGSAKDRSANEDLVKKAETAHPKATLRNRLYEDFGKRGQAASEELAARGSGNASQLAGDVGPPAQPRPPTAGLERQLDTMFVGASLPTVRNNPHLMLPMVDPLTGAPAVVVARDGFRFVDPKEVSKRLYSEVAERRTAGSKRPREPVKAAKKASSQSAAPTTIVLESKPPAETLPAEAAATKKSKKVEQADRDPFPTLSSPVKKRRTAMTYKPATPDRLRLLTFSPNGMPPTPDRPAPINSASQKGQGSAEAGKKGKATRHLNFGSSENSLTKPTTSAKPLTKRQQGIAERNEAAAILSCGIRPLQEVQQEEEDEDDDNPLMHFANVAILAELASLKGAPDGEVGTALQNSTRQLVKS